MSEQQDLISPNYQHQANLPNATAVLVLGIIAILGGLCYGVVGFICGIIGLILGNKDRKLYFGAPELYSASSYGTSNAGRVCAIIGLCLGSLWILFYVLMAVIIMFNMGHTRW